LGSPWQTDVGQYCWLRDLWELDINTYQFTNILPVNNQSIVREGSFTFDYENNIFYILGGFIPTGTYGFYLPSTMDVYKLKKGVDQSFSQIQVNGNPPPPNGYGYSIYDDIGNRIIYARPDGIWALNLGENCNVGFEWSNGNSTQSISVSPQETTTYSVNVNYGNQTCTSFITISVGSEYCNAGTRGDEGARFSDVYLYPNPANQILNLELNVSLETQTNIRITDLLGRVALEQTEDLIAGSNTITYNISDFAKGVYLIQVSNGNEQKVFKLVKE
jgi:hypothetical protein